MLTSFRLPADRKEPCAGFYTRSLTLVLPSTIFWCSLEEEMVRPGEEFLVDHLLLLTVSPYEPCICKK